MSLPRQDIVLRTARTVEKAEALRPVWARLASDINADPDYFFEVLAGRPNVLRPHLVLLERGGEPSALVVARLEEAKLPMRFGYRVVLSPSVRMLSVVYGGFLGERDDAALEALVHELMGALAAREADVVRLRNVRCGSPLHSLALRIPSRLCRQHLSAKAVHWRVPLPSSYEDYLQSLPSSTRGSYRNNRRRLERKLGDQLSVRGFTAAADLDEFMAHATEIASKSYQRGLGAGIADTPQQRGLIRTAMERGWFRAVVVYDGPTPVAFWHGAGYRGVFVTDTPGYDPEYRRHAIGAYALLRLIEELCADPSIDVLDFGFGDAEYKQRLASESWEEEDVLIFAPTVRGMSMNAMRTLLGRANELGKRTLDRAGVIGRVKRGWRERLRGADESRPERPPTG